jgi:hypothetical protein
MHVQVLGEKIRLQMTRKPYNRKRVQKGGELTAEVAHHMIAEKEAKEKEAAIRKETTMLKRIANRERIELHRLGVECRRAERIRRRYVRELEEGDRGSAHLFYPIRDPETEARIASIGDGHQLPIVEEPAPWGDQEEMRRIEQIHGKGVVFPESELRGGADWSKDFIQFDDSDIEIHIGNISESSDSNSVCSDNV